MLELNKIHLLDCMEGMGKFPDKYFDLVIVDPPYGIGEDGASNHSRGCLAETTKFTPKEWDKEKPKPEYFIELFRVSKKAIIWGGNYFIDNLTPSSCWIVWDKDNGNTDFADCELAWTNFDTAVRKFRWRWQGMLQQNMKDKDVRIHPTQKPLALYKWTLKNYAKEGWKILDTHGGSGTCAVACEWLGFDYIVFEKDREYWEGAKARLEDERQKMCQTEMFGEMQL